MPCEDGSVGKDYKDYLGSLRVSYDEVASENTLEYTIIGQQKDGKLTKADGLDMTPVLSGHHTAEQMLQKSRKSFGKQKRLAHLGCLALTSDRSS